MNNVFSLKLPPRNPGNGAREVLEVYLMTDAYGRYLRLPDTALTGPPRLGRTDHLLAWLYEQGFIVERLR